MFMNSTLNRRKWFVQPFLWSVAARVRSQQSKSKNRAQPALNKGPNPPSANLAGARGVSKPDQATCAGWEFVRSSSIAFGGVALRTTPAARRAASEICLRCGISAESPP
jgi:hypothetical protein